jgi:hypothetical protein
MLLWVRRRMRTPSHRLLMWRLHLTHNWMLDMWGRDMVSIRMLLLRLPVRRLRNRGGHFRNRVYAACGAR